MLSNSLYFRCQFSESYSNYAKKAPQSSAIQVAISYRFVHVTHFHQYPNLFLSLTAVSHCQELLRLA